MHGRFARVPEFVGDTGATDEADAAVHQQQLAMVAMEVAQLEAQRQRVVQPQLDPGGSHAVAIGLAHLQAPETVEQAAHAHAPLRRTHQRLEHAFQAMAVLHQIQLEIDAPLCALDRFDHGGKELRPVDQQTEAVVAAPGKYGTGQHHQASPGLNAPAARRSDMAEQQRYDMKSLFPVDIPKQNAEGCIDPRKMDAAR